MLPKVEGGLNRYQYPASIHLSRSKVRFSCRRRVVFRGPKYLIACCPGFHSSLSTLHFIHRPFSWLAGAALPKSREPQVFVRLGSKPTASSSIYCSKIEDLLSFSIQDSSILKSYPRTLHNVFTTTLPNTNQPPQTTLHLLLSVTTNQQKAADAPPPSNLIPDPRSRAQFRRRQRCRKHDGQFYRKPGRNERRRGICRRGAREEARPKEQG